MTQHELVLKWVKREGYIIPAKMAGKIFNDEMFGSETSKRCRELRKAGKLISRKEGRFEVFYLMPQEQPRMFDVRRIWNN